MTAIETRLTMMPPGPKSRLPALNIFKMRNNPLKFLQNLTQEYGDVVQVKVGPANIIVINHPDYIKDLLVTNHKNFVKGRGLQYAKRMLGEGLLTSEGEFHLRQRRLAQPAFHRQRIANYANIMVEYSQRTGEHWQDNQTLDISQEMMRLTLGIVGKTLFDADVEKEAEEIGEALTTSMELFDRFTLPFSALLDRIPFSPSVKRFEQAKARLDATIYRLIAEHRTNGDRGDLLSMLILAQDTEGDGGRMSDLQLRDEAMTIFLAGHETTANALTWTWYLLSQNPEVEKKLQAEVDSVLEGRSATAEDWPKLRYTEMVVAEAMRMYPPAWIMGRRALNDFQIGDYFVPANSIVLASQYIMHHDSRYYPDPDRFDPERWTAEARESRPKFAYFPFGAGPRICIGESFAWMEGVLLLATLAQKWQMRLVPGHPVAMQPLVTLRTKHGMQMTLHKRF